MSAVRDFVRRLTHQRGANFSLGFRLLPADKRRAVYAAYAVCRVADDLVDEGTDTPPERRQEQLDAWAREVEATYAGHPSHAVTRALAEALERYPIPRSAFLGLIEGCRMDLTFRRYATFSQLERYCQLVAVTISEISLAIFGATDPQAAEHGRHLAMALQLTNICRDVGEDAGRGRLCLPLDELEAHGVEEGAVLAGEVDTEAYRRLMAFQCRRASEYFLAANELPHHIEADSRAAVRVMGGVYRRVLDLVASDPVGAYRRRVELPPRQRLVAVLAGLAGQPFVRG